MKKEVATIAVAAAAVVGMAPLATAAPVPKDRPSVSDVVDEPLLKAKAILRGEGHTVTTRYVGEGACNTFRQVVTSQSQVWIVGIDPHWVVRLKTDCD